MRVAFAMVVLFGLAACAAAPTTNGDDGGVADAGQDAALRDGARDAAEDAGADAGPDLGGDSVDAGADAGEDPSDDAGTDAGRDAAGDPDPCGGVAPPECAFGMQIAYCQAHIDALAGCDRLATLIVVGSGPEGLGSDITSLSPLSSVTQFLAGLQINSTQITSLAGLENVTSIQTFESRDNRLLVDVSALAGATFEEILLNDNTLLADLTGLVPSATTRVVISGNPSLTDLSPMAVPELGALQLFDNAALTSVAGLAGLARVGRNLDIGTMPITNLVGLESLAEVGRTAAGGLGGVGLLDSPSLVDLTALSSLAITGTMAIRAIGATSLDGLEGVTVTADMSIFDNPNLTDMDAIGAMTAVGALEIVNNDALTSLPSFALQRAARIRIENNDLLSGAGAFPDLVQLYGLSYSGDPVLTGLSAFPQLTTIRGAVGISATGLTTLGALDAISIDALDVERNADLVALDLAPALDIVNSLIVRDNPRLEHCLVQQVALSATPSSVDERGNLGSGGPCP